MKVIRRSASSSSTTTRRSGPRLVRAFREPRLREVRAQRVTLPVALEMACAEPGGSPWSISGCRAAPGSIVRELKAMTRRRTYRRAHQLWQHRHGPRGGAPRRHAPPHEAGGRGRHPAASRAPSPARTRSRLRRWITRCRAWPGREGAHPPRPHRLRREHPQTARLLGLPPQPPAKALAHILSSDAGATARRSATRRSPRNAKATPCAAFERPSLMIACAACGHEDERPGRAGTAMTLSFAARVGDTVFVLEVIRGVANDRRHRRASTGLYVHDVRSSRPVAARSPSVSPTTAKWHRAASPSRLRTGTGTCVNGTARRTPPREAPRRPAPTSA